MFVSLDVFLIFLTALALIIGLSRSWSHWRFKREGGEAGDWAGLLSYLIFNRSINRKKATGWAHYILVWGFVIFLFVVFLDQVDGHLSTLQAAIVSFVLDVVGLLMLLAVVFFAVKKGFQRLPSKSRRMSRKSLVSILLIGLVVITGFLSEGVRLSIQNNGFDLSAPFGSILAEAMPDSPLVMQLLIRIHIYLVLLFFATLPFSYMRHIASSATNVLHRIEKKQFPMARLIDTDVTTDQNSVEKVDWKLLLGIEACVSCGRCVENCPATIAEKPLVPGELVQNVRNGLARFSSDKVNSEILTAVIPAETAWSCTNCLACIEHCPVYSRPMDLISLARRQMVLGQGDLPEEARAMLRNVEMYKDTMGKGAARRNDWSMRLDINQLSTESPATDILIWVGCSGAFHPRNQEITQALVKILKAANIDFNVLGTEENCCGDPVKRLGDEELFVSLARENITTLSQYQFNQIVTICPHCAHVLKTDYKTLGAMYRVTHATEFVAGLLASKKLNMKYALKADTITIHDPCYLGRAAGVYQPLRDICHAFEGLTVKEMPRNKESSFCCGAGGGRMWLHENQGRNINQVRAEEAFALNVEQITTACPYCLTMFEDGLGSIEAESKPKVDDLIELVASCLG